MSHPHPVSVRTTYTQIIHWYLALQSFKFEVAHRPEAQVAKGGMVQWNQLWEPGDEWWVNRSHAEKLTFSVIVMQRQDISHQLNWKGKATSWTPVHVSLWWTSFEFHQYTEAWEVEGFVCLREVPTTVGGHFLLSSPYPENNHSMVPVLCHVSSFAPHMILSCTFFALCYDVIVLSCYVVFSSVLSLDVFDLKRDCAD